jgi:hypothetical protein
MATKATQTDEALYFQARGLRITAPKELNEAMRLALESMATMLYGAATSELTAAEQAVLRRGGLELEERPGPDPLAKTAAKYAALIDTSLSTKETGEKTGYGAGRIRQMVADRSIYSILLEGRRYLPRFQFLDEGRRLVPEIGRVNTVLDPKLHPVEVYNWYTTPNPDLFLDRDVDATVSPLDWLKTGHPVEPVVRLAKQL